MYYHKPNDLQRPVFNEQIIFKHNVYDPKIFVSQ